MSAAHHHPARLAALTPLRFVTAAMIVAGHGSRAFGVELPASAIYAIAGGVSFFFVLSGFVLAWNYPRLDDARDRVRFLTLRVARVWPLHLAALALFMLCVPRAAWVVPGIDLATALALQVTLLQAWVPVAGYFGAFTAVTWTLSVDVLGYALFPWLLAPMRRAPLATVGVALAVSLAGPIAANAFGAARSDLPMDAVNLYALDRFFPPSRLFEFALGMAAARMLPAASGRLPRRPGVATLVEIAALGVAAAALGALHLAPHAARWIGPGVADWLSQVGAAPALALLVVVLAHGRGAVARAASTRAAVHLGDLSYAVYLLHVTVLLVVPWEALTATVGGPAAALGFVAALLVASHLAWRYVELPARRAIVRAYERRVGATRAAVAPTT
jgi:peptidoglycan/LPS O-acetylase OafA/YrhL